MGRLKKLSEDRKKSLFLQAQHNVQILMQKQLLAAFNKRGTAASSKKPTLMLCLHGRIWYLLP